MKLKKIFTLAVAAMFSCVAATAASSPAGYDSSEAPKHEMRGAWVATVYGIDWPSKTGTTEADAAAQKRELCEILDILKNAGLNAVMFQVRSMSDAMYRSSLEPWSAYLTGSRGTAPAKGWDPLEYAVAEAHKRGLELHAWVNPFRLANGTPPAAAKVATGERNFSPVENGWVLSYTKTEKAPAKKTVNRKGKKGKKASAPALVKKTVSILDPGNEHARNHIVAVCKEIITRYDVDGLIFDDYFYPDGLPLGGGYDFGRWQQECGKTSPSMTQADWRRANVAKTVEAVHEMIQKERPWLRFGISPAGVAGGNGRATEKYGLTPPEVGNDWMYDRIFCNPLDWMAAGTVDYVSPQIYWASDHATNPYMPLAQWWSGIALHFGRHCYPSQKVLALPAGDEAWREQHAQVAANRRNSTGSDAGSIFYSTAHISGKKARGLAEYLRERCYSTPALMPPMPWKDAVDPGAVNGLERQGSMLSWYPVPDMRYVVYAFPDKLAPLDVLASTGANFMAKYIIAVTYDHTVVLPPDKLQGYWYAVAPYDRYGNEWEAIIIGQ